MLPLLVILAGFFFALLGLCYKAAEQHECRPAAFTLAFTLVAGLLTLLKALGERTAWLDTRLWALGAVTGLLNSACIILLVVTNRKGPASVLWVMVNLSLLVPIFLAPALFHEPLVWADALVLGLFLLTLLAFALDAGHGEPAGARTRPSFAIGAMLVFLLNGLTMVTGKYKHMCFGTADTAGYLALAYLTCAASSALWLRRTEKRLAVRPVEWRIGLCAAASSTLGNGLALMAMRLPSAVIFPIIQGVSMLGGVGLLAVWYRERLSVLKLAGIALGLAALLTITCRQSP